MFVWYERFGLRLLCFPKRFPYLEGSVSRL